MNSKDLVEQLTNKAELIERNNDYKLYLTANRTVYEVLQWKKEHPLSDFIDYLVYLIRRSYDKQI